MASRRLGFALLALGLSVFCLAAGEAPEARGSTAVLALLALVLELSAPRLAGFGFLSGAQAVYLAMGLLPGVGVTPAVVLAIATTALRALLQAQGRPAPRLLGEVLAGLIPSLAGLACVVLAQRTGLPPVVSAAGGILACLGAEWTVPPPLLEGAETSWARRRRQSLPALVGVSFCGPGLALLMSHSTWTGLWLVPGLLAMRRIVPAEAPAEGMEAEELRQRERSSRQALAEAHRKLSRTSLDLVHQTEGRVVLEELSYRLAASPNLEGALTVILDHVRSFVPCDSAVVFLAQEDRLVPAGWRTPHAERLRAENLLRIGEPVVQRCWETGQVVVGKGELLAGARLMEGEQTAAALPMGQEGVLYVGRAQPGGFPAEEGHLLSVVAGQGALGIQSARRFAAQQEALALHAREHARQKVWVQRLTYLLEGSRALASALSVEPLLDGLQHLLQQTMQADAGAILLGESPVVVRSWPIASLAGLEPVALSVTGNGHPLLVDDVPTSRFRGLPPQAASFLACPLLCEQGALGAVVLLSGRTGAFTREHQDILHVISFQAAVALHNASLHEQVVTAHRQLELSQAQLVQSSKMAAVGQLAAGVAHEINTPLGAVLLEIESARFRLETRPELVPAKLEHAQQAALACRSIISKLLFYARDAVDVTGPVDLNQVVRDTLEMFGRQLGLDGVTLETDLAPELTPVEGNSNELQQVVTNLLVNARDAVLSQGAQGREVRVSTREEPGFVTLSVADRGCGIAPDDLERIFDPFFTTKAVGRGTGLGLSVSDRIAQQHGGTLRATSRQGEGSCFTLRLPAVRP
ncbi:MAG: ATP-binding protein [Candidatus Eremiobacterota bacterium]